MRFAHMSDCHIGAWNTHPELRQLPIKAFELAMDECLREKVDFILIAGDLFDTSLPSIDLVARAVKKMRECSERGMPIYAIPGSHDYSPSGKTFLNVLDEAGLLTLVSKFEDGEKVTLLFTNDKKTQTKITGIMGRMGSLEKNLFKKIDRSVEQAGGFKIFMFHNGIAEFMNSPDCIPLADLPKGFDYYASGHIHITMQKDVSATMGKGMVCWPGPLFPADFAELEHYDSGLFIVTAANNRVIAEHRKIKPFGVLLLKFSGEDKTTTRLEDEMLHEMEKQDTRNKIVLVRIEGILAAGKPQDLNTRPITTIAKQKGAIAVQVMNKLESKEQSVEIRRGINVETLEKEMIEENAGKLLPKEEEILLVQSLIRALGDERKEGETVGAFEERIRQSGKKILNL